MSITPEDLAAESLTTAATRLDFLSRRDSGETALNTVRDADEDDWSSLIKASDTSLDTPEALELLALGEVVSRKAHDSRLIGIRAALRGGAGWEEIAAALGVGPQEAWDLFHDAIGRQLDGDPAAAATELAGARPAG